MFQAATSEPLQLFVPGFAFSDLFQPLKLADLSGIFFREVRSKNPTLAYRFDVYRQNKGEGMDSTEISGLLVEMAPHLDAFVAKLFGLEAERKSHKIYAEKERILFKFRREFFSRRALKKYTSEQALLFDRRRLDDEVAALKKGFTGIPADDPELELAAGVSELWAIERSLKEPLTPETKAWLDAFWKRLAGEKAAAALTPPDDSAEALKQSVVQALETYEKWLVFHFYNKTPLWGHWATFKQPEKIDFDQLVELESPQPGFNIGIESRYRRRDGFDLTDLRYEPREIMREIDYCVFCHERDKDSCSKGFVEKDGAFKKNPLGNELRGCPLDQKISESNLLGNNGDLIGALAIILIDNPMCPGTGHRICNDCMKSCIYQKQEPVNIPQIETRLLTDVLRLPWGFEIYSLLTRWNPLNVQRPHALPYNGKKILVVGLGPAGYTMAHYLLNEGFGVVGIDGLKIEPLPAGLTGQGGAGFQPLKDFSAIYENLSERVLLGFGGVSEYGITVRWDKNFLTVVYLNLLRREFFRIYDGVRFGGTLTVDDAWDMGFDHICFATGAGKPTFVSMKNNLIRGIRKASDFLMALQLTGAGKKDSMANLQVQLPALVIGGGLTAIDTATELMAYYPVQVSKTKHRYEALCAYYGRENVDALYTPDEKQVLDTFLQHANALEAERERAAQAGEKPDFIPLLRAWGGVHLYYRKSMNDSPAYRLNHEEIIKALEEGISFVEKMSPLEAVPDEHGALEAMVFERLDVVDGKWKSTGETQRIPAKTLMVAAGTVPNVMYEREYPGTFQLDKGNEFFQNYNLVNGQLTPAENGAGGFLTSYEKNGKYITFYGDNHPVFEGNVVKAMASAKNGYKQVVALFQPEIKREAPSNGQEMAGWQAFVARFDDQFKPHVVRVERLTPTITEVVVHAPVQARKFKPGQFFRLQNYEVDSPRLEGTLLMVEGIALTGAWVDVEKGLLGMIVLEVGASSRMVSMLRPGQRVVVMGPTGTPTEVPENDTLLLLGGGLGNAVLFSIAKAAKERGTNVIYFAGYKKKADFFKREEIESATDVVVYSVDGGDPIPAQRPQDKSFVGNIVQAMIAYASGQLGDVPIPLREASRIIAIGSDRMMAAVTQARHGVLEPYLKAGHDGIASINSPMQCMMKAICAQCLQRHVDPETGKESFVFSCVNQDQEMDHVDFQNLHSRLLANGVLEKTTDKWLDYIFEKNGVEHV
ncbi:MAG: FAD-dependent oxidoreductase [Saprospirales bacterium]|nr:FAD-dependent oxidoreductase [Saprospirales bacterium]